MRATSVQTRLRVDGVDIRRIRLGRDPETNARTVVVYDPVFGTFSIDSSFKLCIHQPTDQPDVWTPITLDQLLQFLGYYNDIQND